MNYMCGSLLFSLVSAWGYGESEFDLVKQVFFAMESCGTRPVRISGLSMPKPNAVPILLKGAVCGGLTRRLLRESYWNTQDAHLKLTHKLTYSIPFSIPSSETEPECLPQS